MISKHANGKPSLIWTSQAHIPVAVWMRHANPSPLISSPPDARLPELSFIGVSSPSPVLVTPTTAIFELPFPRAYFKADSCTMHPTSSDRLVAQCERPSRLVRLELAMRGWTARLNGVPVPVQLANDTFQAVDLPAGLSTIVFRYDPVGVRASTWPALGALLLALALLATPRAPRKVNNAPTQT